VALPVRREKNFHLDREDLEPHLAEARLLILNSPLNPTGTCISREALRGICEAVLAENRRRERAGERALFLVYDQVYHTLTFRGAVHHTPVGLVPEIAPYTFLADAVSKGLCGTGLRVGWIVGPADLVAKMAAMAGHHGAWAPRAEQVATAGFLRDREALRAHRERMRTEVLSRLELLYEGFLAMQRSGLPVEPIEPQGAIYLSVRFDVLGRKLAGSTVRTNEELRAALLERADVALVPFEAFGLPAEGWMRASVGAASREGIAEGLERVRRLLEGVRS
jgi:aspartate aminotransferase